MNILAQHLLESLKERVPKIEHQLAQLIEEAHALRHEINKLRGVERRKRGRPRKVNPAHAIDAPDDADHHIDANA